MAPYLRELAFSLQCFLVNLKKARLKLSVASVNKYVIALLFLSLPSLAAAKKTLCSIAINSQEERETFKKYLSKDAWDLVELIPSQKSKPNDDEIQSQSVPQWLMAACEQKIQCDLLVISGHFGGGFFGDSGYSLTLEQMERASCRPECAGIFNKPKEVFLFGCNTLAGKQKDLRTPEQYMEALRTHNELDEAQRQQAVAYRYSPWGSSNYLRMSSVFHNSSHIYGFDSVGPSGINAEPMLKKYLSKTGADYHKRIESSAKSDGVNQFLATLFRSTTYVEGAGAAQPHRAGSCYLEDEGVSREAKFQFVDKQLNGPNPFYFAPDGTAYGTPHPELWLRFAEGTGVSREEIRTAKARTAIRNVVDSFHTLSRASYAQALGAIYAYESQVPEVAQAKIEGLKRHFGIVDERSLSFFEVHKTADIDHRETLLALIEALPADQRAEAKRAADQACRALWDFLSDIPIEGACA